MNNIVVILSYKELPYGVVELRSDNILVFRPDIAIFKQYDLEILKELLGERGRGNPKSFFEYS